jgi:Tat protein secretion system quality control protein TatD with DNase activity
VKKIAEIKGLSEEEVVKITTENAYKVYGIKR